MDTKPHFAIGMMSGTSLDGLDLCYVKFEESTHWSFEIIHCETIKYPILWEEKLRSAPLLSTENLLELNAEYGFYLGEMVENFIKKFNIERLDVIASHGHTIFHQPKKKFTLQIGDGRAIKLITQKPVVYDFRTQDVLMGGNGAPLVPIGDQLLFSTHQACINLGGFSNISFLKNGKRIAFDICPVNLVLNLISKKLGKEFDSEGNLAKSGTISLDFLEKLNKLPYYFENYPKSLGAEWVQEHITFEKNEINEVDFLATFTEHIAIQIATILNKYNIKNSIFTGGGTFNTFLIEKIRQKTNCEIYIPEAQLINYKEALIFALMGVLKIENKINVLSSSTGSFKDHSTGVLA